MGLLKLTLVFLAVLGAAVGEQHWALLVAGSSGYGNYRHQADICHAYHVLRDHGFPEERIIVMMYDDIANSPENPFPGNVINHPQGPNLYPGVPKHYTRDEVTPEVFLKVLTGDSQGVQKLLGRPGKVINSGPDDRIFVNFADHGAPGILAFPSEMLKATDLHNAIKSMYNDKKYKQMVFYVEACESGSMFDKLLESNINVFATTAANPDESSYACYYDDQRETYLGDVYSVNWMEDSDKENLAKDTLQNQYKLVKEETNTSHVMEYGDMKMGKLILGDFQGNLTSSRLTWYPEFRRSPLADAVPSEDVALEILKRKLAKSMGDSGSKHGAAIDALLKRKEETEQFFKEVVTTVTGFDLFDMFVSRPLSISDFKCYEESVRLVREMCPGMDLIKNDYALRKLRVLANLCETHIPEDKIWGAIGKVTFESAFCGKSK